MNAWIEAELGGADFGDPRLDERLRRLVAQKWQKPQASFSAGGQAAAMAASRFFTNEKVSQEKILAPHRQRIVERIGTEGHRQVLLLQDTTECDYTSHPKLVGAGPLAGIKRRGFFAHNHLVITPEHLPLGLWDTLIYARDDEGHGQAKERAHWPIEEKESFRWLLGYRHACDLASQVPATQIVSVSDRESDIYELFAEYAQRRADQRPVAELLIRNKDDRALAPWDEAEAAPPGKIRAQLAAAAPLGTVAFDVPAATRLQKTKAHGPQSVERTARRVVQEIRALRLRLRPPSRPAPGGGPLPVVEITVVEAREIHPPPGEPPLVWVLLTTLPVETLAQAQAVLELYRVRWEIELFHRILKSGCRMEELQQRFDFTLAPAILLCMLVAWRLLYVMHLGRAVPDLPCDVVFDADEWQPVVVVLQGRAALATPPTLAEMIRLVAQLGGYLGRKKDPPPGMKCLWLGLVRVADFALCWKNFGRLDTS